ncbi:inhibitor of host toxin/antitoxin system [Salmonella phage vB_SalS_PC192]|uniref:Inhibitor of host toxin/antitoxin system n=1 Tax=Salmonella phage vB_SalM_PC127 TaxID=2961705 RepID=A0A9E7NYU9_9CAUD|nr:inhibitor of host toxin/antitoxin system [Salmonella phage vB_SalM_PC127]UVK80587.1 inhibitor of host toxin/antitoxin system [Salmonella phage vB_SalS_PC192]
MAIKFPGNTIRLSDTIDQYARRVHINVRNGKVTLVYRWKDHKSTKAHTQRVTLDDTQAGRLLASVAVAATVAVGEDKTRELLLSKVAGEEGMMLAAKSEI